MEGNVATRSPLTIPILAWLLGIIIANYLPLPPVLFFLVFTALLLLAFSNYFRTFIIIMLCVLLGLFHNSDKKPLNHIKHIIKHNQSFLQPIEGRISSEVVKEKSKYRFILDLNTIGYVKVTGKINFTTFQDSLEYGDIINTVARVRKIPKNSNPSSFNYEEFLSAKDIYAQGYPKTIIRIEDKSSALFKRNIFKIRKFFRKRIEDRFGEYSGLIKTIVIGDKDHKSEWRSLLTKAGLSHLLAVSGLHVGIIALVLMIILQIIIPYKNVCRMILVVILFIYAAICLWSPSVTRAAIMISMYLLAKILQRKLDINNVLLLSLLLITVFNPDQLFSIGLQMSFMAVFVLLNILPKVNFIKFGKEDLKLMKFSKKLLNGILILVLTSLILNVFLAPLTMYYFNQFNFNGLLGNILGIPLISVILPLSLLIIFFPNFELILSIFQNSFKGLTIIFKAWANIASKIPFYFNFVSINLFQLFTLYLLLILIFYWQRWKIRFYWKTGITIILALLFMWLGDHHEDKMKFTFFDCGSVGDLFLIETSNDQAILIDSGPPDSFEKSALPYFQKNGLKKLDWVLITHAHNDHYGGLKYILENMEVKNLIITDEFQSRTIWSDLKVKENCRILTVRDTMHLNLKSLKFKILHPNCIYEDDNINNLSIVNRIDYKQFSLLFTGDLEKEGEEYLLELYPEFLDCDFLKIGHHGSKTSSSKNFLKTVSPEYAFIPTSLHNKFNFPHKETLTKLEFLDDQLYIAGKDGALQITTDGKTAHFQTYLTQREFIDTDLDR